MSDGKENMTRHADVFSPLLAPWRRHQRLAVLRLRADVVGASRVPVYRAGQRVLATWSSGQRPLASGWIIRGAGFLCIMNEPDVEVIERP